jgi:hypothetical protein
LFYKDRQQPGQFLKKLAILLSQLVNNLATLLLGTVSIVTLAALSIHRLMTVKNIPGWKIGTFQQSTG